MEPRRSNDNTKDATRQKSVGTGLIWLLSSLVILLVAANSYLAYLAGQNSGAALSSKSNAAEYVRVHPPVENVKKEVAKKEAPVQIVPDDRPVEPVVKPEETIVEPVVKPVSIPVTPAQSGPPKVIHMKYNDGIDYLQLYLSNGTAPYYKTNVNPMGPPPFGGKYTSPEVLKDGCPLSVVLMDPRLPSGFHQDPKWFTLESVATHIPHACVILQTASCEVRSSMERNKAGFENTLPESQVVAEVARRIYQRALPKFRAMIDRGQVRVTILDHAKYKLASCHNFYNPSNVWMNYFYWNKEFLAQDNDLVMIIQSDAVLCHDLDIDRWRDVAYVGAPWAVFQQPAKAAIGRVCPDLKRFQHRWFFGKKIYDKVNAGKTNKPPWINPATIKNPCSTPRLGGPMGNGGLSLRSRKWMRKAIQTCPSADHSGLNTAAMPLACLLRATTRVNEDVYFAAVLPAIGAPLPTGLEAALFSSESSPPRDQMVRYSRAERQELWQKRLGIDYNHTHIVDNEGFDSIGIHKPWGYLRGQKTRHMNVMKTCPLYKFVHPDSFIFLASMYQ